MLIIFLSMAASGKTLYVSSRNGVNLRAKPSTESEIIDKLDFGTACEKIKTSSLKGTGWRKVAVDDQVGYVMVKYLQKNNPLDEFEYLGDWMITAYAETGFACANGNYPSVGYTIACNSLDFGTEVYISEIGFRTVEDRGPGHLGSEWLDLYLGDHSSCVNFGIQYHDVYIVSYGED